MLLIYLRYMYWYIGTPNIPCLNNFDNISLRSSNNIIHLKPQLQKYFLFTIYLFYVFCYYYFQQETNQVQFQQETTQV